MLRRVALVTTDISEERSVSIIRMTIGELGTRNLSTLRRNTVVSEDGIRHSHRRENFKSYIPLTGLAL
jgi:hypothetical protein